MRIIERAEDAATHKGEKFLSAASVERLMPRRGGGLALETTTRIPHPATPVGDRYLGDPMSTQTETRGAMRKASKTRNHAWVGRDVLFRGRVWRVVKGEAPRRAHGSPWLTLRRGDVEAIAKPYELEVTAN